MFYWSLKNIALGTYVVGYYCTHLNFHHLFDFPAYTVPLIVLVNKIVVKADVYKSVIQI